jgi:hypothetical protein
MKRRSFLKATTVLAAGAASASVVTATSCTNESSKTRNRPVYFKNDKSVAALKTLENEFLKVTLFSDASAKIEDKKNNTQWDIYYAATQEKGPLNDGYVWIRMDRSFMETYPGKFNVEPDGDAFKYTLMGRQNAIKGTFRCSVVLDSEWLKFNITEIDSALPSLVFPPHIESDYVVIPEGLGKMKHKDKPEIFSRKFYTYGSLNMNWIGGLKDKAAWMAVFDENIIDGGALMVNNSIAPGWVKSMGQWKKNYSIKYKFIKGGYVDLAKTYRKYLIEKGLFKSLKEKIKENPLLAHAVGGRHLSYFQAWPPIKQHDERDNLYNDKQIHLRETDKVTVDFTHKDVLKSLKHAQSLGFKNGIVMLRGWQNKGYDGIHPDIWPPEPLLGPIEDLKEIMALPEPMIPALHDQYQDVYSDTKKFPKGVNVLPDGDLMAGGVWAGGQGYIMSSKYSIENAKENWENVKTLNPKALFIDTVTAACIYESWGKDNPQTRTEDLEYKKQLLQFFRSQGKLMSSEEGSEMGIAYCDWNESRHYRKENENIPLWPLVFHDAVIMSRYNSFEPGSPYPKWLEDMLWGYQLQFFMSPQFGGIKPADGHEKVGFGANAMDEEMFKSTFHVDEWHKKIALSEMTNHRILTEDGKVEETTFEPGGKIIVNFSNETRTIEGTTIKANSYVIKG